MVKNIINKDVKVLLENASVCQRCILRFLGEKEYTSYVSKVNTNKAIINLINGSEETLILDGNENCELIGNENDPASKRFLPTPCAACLGILQDKCDEIIPKIEEEVAASQHQFKEFVLHIALPVIFDLRDRLFMLYLKDKFGESYDSKESDIPSVKDICKWVIGSKYGKLTSTEFTPDSDFQIYISSLYPETVKECLVLFKKCPEAFPNGRKRTATEDDIYTKKSVLKAMEALSSEIQKLYDLPPSPPEKSCSFTEIKCTHSPLYLGGRYNKYSRELSQTPWVVDGERRMESSVSELITDVVQKHILADKIVFSSSGREDVDVKMLGNGRPFVLELLNPRRLEWSTEEMEAIENEINKSTTDIAVRHLQVITKLDTALLKEGEEQKRKTYSALCFVEKTLTEEDIAKLESIKDLVLYQKTPIRVLHRRTLSTREKLLHSVQAKMVGDHQLLLKIETQAGTYVKEFAHSDFGRTVPNLGTLLNTTADILELDVESIELEWPPKCIS
ncbi:hypothetical protein JTE90_025304 [Oedothorax gibbosus]|uniref:tRNA pseudouridine(55) synthase n=1 Tax=Oedothorax gibbosus TaxID=931172 RepID=A0AAV6V7G5_9ARAC|nr:hypothetical protein JTE90_025304 [Oedothorax gibbosus]